MTLVTTYLEMTDLAQFKPAYVDVPTLTIMRMAVPDIAFYRFLYRAVGEKWRWRDRLLLSDDELRTAIAGTQVHVLYENGVPGGYIELATSDVDEIEVAYFGLREAFIGRGFGKHLLSYGVQQAWDSGAKRIWLHTCNLDSPYALANYQARGFSIYDVRREPMPGRYL